MLSEGDRSSISRHFPSRFFSVLITGPVQRKNEKHFLNYGLKNAVGILKGLVVKPYAVKNVSGKLIGSGCVVPSIRKQLASLQ